MSAPLPADERQQFEAWAYEIENFATRIDRLYEADKFDPALFAAFQAGWKAARAAAPVEISDLLALAKECGAERIGSGSMKLMFKEPALLAFTAALRARLGGQTGSDGVNPSGKDGA